MYSLKREYNILLLEEVNDKVKSMNALSSDTLVKYSDGIFVGKFSVPSLELWNIKDGNGGRGEYTTAAHFLRSTDKHNSLSFDKQKPVVFLSKLSIDTTLIDNAIFTNVNTSEDVLKEFSSYLTSEFNFNFALKSGVPIERKPVKEFLKNLKDGNYNKLKSSKYFQATDMNTNEIFSSWLTILRALNKAWFLKNIDTNFDSGGKYSDEDKMKFDLITSVTTSGKDSKSTDVVIQNNRVKDEFKQTLGLSINDPLTIEVKEISSVKSSSEGAGIRLASGSRLESLKNDIIFSLTIICIVVDINNSMSLGYILDIDGKTPIEDEVLDVFTSFKENQISATKVKRMIELLSDIKTGTAIINCLRGYIHGVTPESCKREIGLKAIESLETLLNQQTTSEMRKQMIDDSLASAIDGSINANYLCILNGRRASAYNSTDKKFGNKEFIMIHRSKFQDVLKFASYQSGGTAYAGIKDKDVVELLYGFFGQTRAEGVLYSIETKNEKRVRFIKKLKNLISEGGKAGHMMHPYENLHMKISDMKSMIRDFQNDFEISEKVDGANLFFTINPDTGELLFSRNKADMTREETLEKFGPSHPAHILFTEGANSIYNAAKASLSRDDAKEIFGQAPNGGKTYINFEIMHPKKPNQIKYDMKYVVFHTIVDFDINGVKVNSSPDDPRLLSLLEKMQPYFATEDNDFNLGSNLKVKLNALSDADIDELMSELNKITSSLNLSDDMTIADAIKKEIEMLLDKNNLTELLSVDKIEMIYDFITNESSTVTGNIIKKDLDKEIKKSLVGLGLTSKAKAYKIVKQITKEFRPLFILLGIKLLHNISSRYMSSEASNKNVDELRRLLNAALEDYDNIINLENPSDIESRLTNTLSLHVANIRSHGIERSVSSPIEGGVFIGKDGNTYKVTGGFAPLNQILGTAMRSLEYMPIFEREFDLQERRS